MTQKDAFGFLLKFILSFACLGLSGGQISKKNNYHSIDFIFVRLYFIGMTIFHNQNPYALSIA